MPKSKNIVQGALEEAFVSKRLKEKYPQMYKKGWGKAEKKKSVLGRVGSKLKKVFSGETTRTKTTKGGMKTAGVNDKEIGKFQGKKK